MEMDHIEKITNLLEEYNIDQAVIDEVLSILKDPLNGGTKTPQDDTVEAMIRTKMFEAKDWRERSRLAAFLIAHHLDKGY